MKRFAKRLRHPFRPFFLKTTAGKVFLVDQAEHLALARQTVVVVDYETQTNVPLTLADIDSIVYTNEPVTGLPDGH